MIFYTYLWLREDGTPYYVGKGSGKRAFRKGSPCFDRIIVQEHPCESDAFAVEIFLIAYYGRKDLGTGSLINRTDGGDGLISPSKELRFKISNTLKVKGIKPPSRKGIKHTTKVIESIRRASKGREFSEAFKIARDKRAREPKPHLIGNKHGLGHKHTEEVRKIISDATWQRHHIQVV